MKKLIPVLAAILCFIYIFKPSTHSELSPFIKYNDLIKNSFRVGFTNLEQEITVENIPVQGAIPKWLTGTLLRNGPAKFTAGSSYISNWLDGLAMVHAFTFRDGKVNYRNKFLHTSDYELVQKTGSMNYAGFISGDHRSLAQRLYALVTQGTLLPTTPNANVNIAEYEQEWTALTEIPLPVRFDESSLETLGNFQYTDNLPTKNIHTTPHPHFDPVNNDYISWYTEFGISSSYNLYKMAADSSSRVLLAQYPVKQPSYMHSFAITQDYAILIALPLKINPLKLLYSSKGFIENFLWQPELGTELIVIDRLHKEIVGTFKTEPFFAFHTINAFQTNDGVSIDLVCYKDATILSKFYFNNILAPDNNSQNIQDYLGEPTRLHINFGKKVVSKNALTNDLVELPRINYSFNGRDYTYFYGISQLHEKKVHPYAADCLKKFDVKLNKFLVWHEPDCYVGEPVFVPKPDAREEDDGVVLSVILQIKTEKSFLLVLDGKNFKEIGRINLPHHIPYGIHGIFSSE